MIILPLVARAATRPALISEGTERQLHRRGGTPPRERPEEKPPRRACVLARVPQPGPPSRLASWLRIAGLLRRPARAAILGAAAAAAATRVRSSARPRSHRSNRFENRNQNGQETNRGPPPLFLRYPFPFNFSGFFFLSNSSPPLHPCASLSRLRGQLGIYIKSPPAGGPCSGQFLHLSFEFSFRRRPTTDRPPRCCFSPNCLLLLVCFLFPSQSAQH